MKLSYYGYSIEHARSGTRYLFNLQPFIRAFTQQKDAAFQSRFSYGGEQLFLLHESASLYLFLTTRNREVIKKIKSTDLSVSEVYDSLNEDEHLGFASYVYIADDFLGFASTVMAPKVTAFGRFVSDIFAATGLVEYRIDLHPLIRQSTRADAMSLPFIGRSVIQVTKESSLYEDIRGIFKGSPDTFADVDSFEIVMKPRPRQNIDKAAKTVISHVGDAGLDKMMVQAREEVGGHLVDIYLAGKGQLSDRLNRSESCTMAQQVVDKIRANTVLSDKVKEHKANEEFTHMEPSGFTELAHADAWASRIVDLPVGG